MQKKRRMLGVVNSSQTGYSVYLGHWASDNPGRARAPFFCHARRYPLPHPPHFKFWSRLALDMSIKGLEGEGFQRERVALGYNVFPVVSKKAFPCLHLGLV